MKKLLYINIDGFSYSYYERLYKEGKSAVFEGLKEEGVFFNNLRSGLISITNPMQSAILCGAFSAKTHNFYQHYDVNEEKVVKHLRTFDAQNVSQLFVSKGGTSVSIHQFMLENNPNKREDKKCCYITSDREHSDLFDRFDLLKKLVKGEPIKCNGELVTYDEFPDFTALYVDDIDSLGHNNEYEQYPKRANLERRLQDIEQRLIALQQQLAEFVELAKSRGVYDDLIILLTTDHGMTPYFGESKLDELVNALNLNGITTTRFDNIDKQATIVALPYTIEVSLFARRKLTRQEIIKIKNIVQSLGCVDRVFDKKEMLRDFGMAANCADFLVSPRYGYHFYKKDVEKGTYGASHDSFDETSQHTFGMIFGGKINKKTIEQSVSAIDLLPTILAKKFRYKLKDATGKIFTNWF